MDLSTITNDDIRNPSYTVEGNIDCEINHPEFGWVPFTASANDPLPYGVAIFDFCVDQGPADYAEPAPSPVNFPLQPYQFHAMLDVLGKTDAVHAAIDNVTDDATRAVVRAKMQHMRVYERDDPLFAVLAPAVGLTDAEIDTAWMQAKDL